MLSFEWMQVQPQKQSYLKTSFIRRQKFRMMSITSAAKIRKHHLCHWFHSDRSYCNTRLCHLETCQRSLMQYFGNILAGSKHDTQFCFVFHTSLHTDVKRKNMFECYVYVHHIMLTATRLFSCSCNYEKVEMCRIENIFLVHLGWKIALRSLKSKYHNSALC